MKFRQEQKKIMEYTEGIMAVPSVPGAGKTFILSNLTARLIEMGKTKDGKILIVTYMNSSVSNFKNRIYNLLNEKGIKTNKDYEVMTIHSLAMQIVRESPEYVNLQEDVTLVDDVTQISIIDRCITDYKLLRGERFREYLNEDKIKGREGRAYEMLQDSLKKAIKYLIGELKCKGISAQSFLAMVEGSENTEELKLPAWVYRRYDEQLKNLGFIDYNDILYYAVKILSEKEEVRHKFQLRYAYVFEDEAQDSNLIQQTLLSIISEKHGNFVRVGDGNQAIMSTFTSSDPELFLSFCERASRVEKMLTAGRSSEDIIDLANFLVAFTREKHELESCRDALQDQKILPLGKDDPFKNPVTEKYGVRAYLYDSFEDEIKRSIKLCDTYRKMYPDKTMAMLLPSGYKIQQVIEQIKELAPELPYEELDSTSGERTAITRKLGYILEFISNPWSGEALSQVIKEVFYVDNGEEDVFLKELPRVATEMLLFPIGEVIPKGIMCAEAYESKSFQRFIENREVIRDLLQFSRSTVEQLIIYVGEKLAFTREERALLYNVANDVKYLFITNPKWTISDLAKELISTKNNRFNYFAKFVYELKGYQAKPGQLTLSTYHKSKGLEWDFVMLMCLNSSDFPYNLKDKFLGENFYAKEKYSNMSAIYKAELEKLLSGNVPIDPVAKARLETIKERIRLLYVGITRAKENLIINAHRKEGNNLRQPSSYFMLIKDFVEGRCVQHEHKRQ